MDSDPIDRVGKKKRSGLRDTLEEWEEALEALAQEIKREFDDAMYTSRNRAPKEWYRHAVRVRSPMEERHKGVKRPVSRLSIEWRRMEWITTQGGAKKYQARHVRKGPSNHYALSKFRPVSEEERNRIAWAEEQFARIRQQIMTIGSLRKTLANTQRKQRKQDEEEME